MTDNDIKTICEKLGSLQEKILKSKFAEQVYESEITALALAVGELTRQKAEIERLKSMNQSKLDMIHDLRAEIENTQQSVGNWILKPEKFVDVSYNNDMSINETIVGDCYLICSECGREFFVYEYIGEDSQKSINFDTLLKEFPYCTCGTKMKEIKYGWKALL